MCALSRHFEEKPRPVRPGFYAWSASRSGGSCHLAPRLANSACRLASRLAGSPCHLTSSLASSTCRLANSACRLASRLAGSARHLTSSFAGSACRLANGPGTNGCAQVSRKTARTARKTGRKVARATRKTGRKRRTARTDVRWRAANRKTGRKTARTVARRGARWQLPPERIVTKFETPTLPAGVFLQSAGLGHASEGFGFAANRLDRTFCTSKGVQFCEKSCAADFLIRFY